MTAEAPRSAQVDPDATVDANGPQIANLDLDAQSEAERECDENTALLAAEVTEQLEEQLAEARTNRDRLAHQVAALRQQVAEVEAERDDLQARLLQREAQHAERLAEQATVGDTGICRTCALPITFATVEEPGYLPRTGWSDGARTDALVCFSAVHYRHVPLVGRERAIWDKATNTAEPSLREFEAKLGTALAELTELTAERDAAREALEAAEGERDDLDTAVGTLLGENVELEHARAAQARVIEQVTRLAEHLAEDAQRLRCDLTAFPSEGDMHEYRRDDRGRCKGDVVGVRWEHGWADWVCERHAVNAEGRGVLVIRPKHHDGTTAAAPTPHKDETGPALVLPILCSSCGRALANLGEWCCGRFVTAEDVAAPTPPAAPPLVESVARALYERVMDATADEWTRWQFLTEHAKAPYVDEAQRIVAAAAPTPPAEAEEDRQ